MLITVLLARSVLSVSISANEKRTKTKILNSATQFVSVKQEITITVAQNRLYEQQGLRFYSVFKISIKRCFDRKETSLVFN